MCRVKAPSFAWLPLAVGAVALSGAPIRALGAESRALSNFTSTEFDEVTRLADLPAELHAALDLKTAPMADAGGDWNSGCVVDARPGRRFIYAGKSPDLWFVFFEVGGRSHYQRVLTFRRGAGGVFEREGNWAFNALPKTISELKKTVSAHVAKYGEQG
jgi:hypothetical protein